MMVELLDSPPALRSHSSSGGCYPILLPSSMSAYWWNVSRPLPARVAEHPQHRVDQHRGHADRDRHFPADIHQLVVAIAGKRAAEPDHQVDNDRHLHQKPE